jgi:RNA polymerase sigma factor (sigma-70 family)
MTRDELEAELPRMAKWLNTTTWRWWRTYRCYTSRDDVRSVVLLAVVDAARRYDPAMGATLETFSEYTVRSYMRLYIAREVTGGLRPFIRRNGFNWDAPSLVRTDWRSNTDPFGDMVKFGDELRAAISREDAEPADVPTKFWEAIRNLVGERPYRVLRMRFVEGLSEREVAERLGTSRTVPYVIMRRAFGRIRECLPGIAKYLGMEVAA